MAMSLSVVIAFVSGSKFLGDVMAEDRVDVGCHVLGFMRMVGIESHHNAWT